LTTKNDKIKKSSSDKEKTLLEVSEIIDNILDKHKEKMDELHARKDNLKKFFLKDKNGKTVYYLRKTSKKKTGKDDDSEVLSEKIISEARNNLGVDPLEIIDEPEEKSSDSTESLKSKDIIDYDELDAIVAEIDNLPENKKDEKRGFFKKKKSQTIEEKIDRGDTDFISPSTEDLAGLEKKYKGKIEFFDINSDSSDKKTNKNDSEFLDEKIRDNPVSKDVVETDVGVKKAYKLAETHIKEKVASGKESQIEKSEVVVDKKQELSETKKSFFKKKKSPSAEEIKKEDNSLDDSNFKSDTLSDANATDEDEDEARLLDEQISKKPLTGNVNEAVAVKEAEPDIFKAKKSFFKKKTLPLVKENRDESKVKKEVIKSKFHVANHPSISDSDKDEASLLDEKIREISIDERKDNADKEAEEKALKLAKEHISKESLSKQPKEISPDKKTQDDTDKIIGNPLDAEQSEHEHVFFDESESSSSGWSPTLTDDQKKKMSMPFSSGSQVVTEDIKTGSDIELPKEVLQTKSVTLSELGFSAREWEELDFYPLHEPFAFVEILRERESLDKCYFLVEVELTEEEEKLLAFIRETMAQVAFDTAEMETKGDDKYLTKILDQVVDEYNIKFEGDSKEKILYYIGRGSLGLGKIDPLMRDPNIEDISCDGAGVPIFLYHRQYGSLKSNIKFDDEDQLSSFVSRLAQKCGKHISIAEPMLDATMPDGSRIQMTLSDEITAKGSTFTIRKFREDPFSPPDMVEFNTMSSEMVAYMWLAFENGINTLFAGGTASGKTTALNALSLFIPRESKIVSIEETREINLPHPNWIPGVARSGFGEVVADKVVGQIDMYDLMKAALRQRPEYIIVGEIRGREAYVLFQAMATGHATYSTVHADSAQSLIHRLEGKPINIPRVMLQSLDIVCLHVITRVKNKRARRCRQVIEIIDIDPTTKEILTNEAFRWDPVEDKFVYSGKSYVLERIRAEKDMTREKMTEELRRRTEIIEWMNNTNVREFRGVANLVARYLDAPDETYKQIKKDVKN